MNISEPYSSPALDLDLLEGRDCVSFIFLSLATAPDTGPYLINAHKNICAPQSAIDKYTCPCWHLCMNECFRLLAEHKLRAGDGRWQQKDVGSVAEVTGTS